MDKRTKLQKKIINLGIDIQEGELPDNIRGIFYSDGITNLIGLNKNIATTTEKTCVVAEELGHYYTTNGNLLISNNAAMVKKQEIIARRLAFSLLISYGDIVDAFKKGCRNAYEIAEFIGVTEEFLCDALMNFQEKYGSFVLHKGYRICFDPFGVAKERRHR